MVDLDILQTKVQALSATDKQAYEDLLEGNGISQATALESPHEMTELEMFLFNFPRMVCFDLFPNLQTLTLTQQGISKIENLQGCPNLQNLWIVENSIEVIEGLDGCRRLRQLYLYSNRIRRISNLNLLTQLEVLWLADNQIVVLEGLENLEKLRELNLARNQIDQIGDLLSHNSNLEILNLADNQIGAFKEVCYLARLPKLVHLCFNDPHWGECPLAGLCNYQTYVLFNLQQLSSLDSLALPEETKQLAEATFMKKKMYYNMRIKTLRRNTSNAIRRANQGRAVKVGDSVAMFELLSRQLKDVEGELQAAEAYSHYNPDPAYISALKAKGDALMQAVGVKVGQINAAQLAFEACKARVHELSNEYVRRMMVELETGGNIRMEDGKPTDLWHSSCVDLVTSRFFPNDFSAMGVKGLKVTRVTRIHNRFLRNRFEEHLESLVDMSDSSYKRSLEYLFYGDNPSLPGELQRVADDGFRHPSEYAAMGLDGAIALSNSVSVVDLPRLEHSVASSRAGAERNPLVGQVLVSKVFLGKCVQESALATSGLGHNPVAGKQRLITSRADYPDCNSVFRVKQSDPKQRLWYVFDHALVLPEYLVEFEYEAAPVSKLSVHQRRDTLSSDGQAVIDKLDFDLRPIARPLVPLLLSAAKGEFDQNGNPIVKLTGNESGSEAASMPPEVSKKPEMVMITPEGLKLHSGTEGLTLLTFLDLHGSGIKKIDGLSSLVALRALVLSFNDIHKIEGLSELTLLVRLDLSFNSIRRIEGLKGLGKLKHLELNNNNLQRLEDVNVLKKYVPDLTTLDLSSNPICTHKTYRTLLLRRLPRLIKFDRQAVSKEDLEAASENTSTLTVQVIKDHSFSRRSSSIAVGGILAAGQAGNGDDSWWHNVEELVVEHQRVRRIQNLENLTRLRRASFADNELTRLEGLDQCTALEELSVEDNRIMAIDGLSRCTALKKLELGKNKIGRLENLGALTALTQLSVEDNDIESLMGIAGLQCLMELYIGNNRISWLREVLHIKDLPKLIIVDLLGNPLCQEEDYRLYAVYHLKKLKVLDGTGIEAAEQSAAKNKYAGRLTMDMLEAKVGHRAFERLRELNISGLRIRDVASCLQTPEFSGLQEVNMDTNMMTDVQGFAHLANLMVLRLGNNKIGDGCRFDVNPYSSITPFPALQVLQLGQNAIASIERLGLGKLSTLRSLFLQGNDITKVDGLEGLLSLQELVLDRNRIKYVDAGAFTPVYNLRELRLEENGLRSLSNVGVMPQLQALHLSYNRISDTAELERLVGLTELMEISLVNNPVVRKQVYRAVILGKVPSLRVIDGREVTFEEREYINSMFAANSQPVGMDAINSMGVLIGNNSVNQPQKVSLKMNNLNFEQLVHAGSGGLISLGSDGPSIPGGGASGMAGLELQGGGLGVVGQRTASVPRPGSNDRPGAPSVGYVIGGRSMGTGNIGQPAQRGGRAIGGLSSRPRQAGGYSNGGRR
mmetsp:Transcript_34109/g.96662  ORF Transcript_34109/g.96662 Transcript_34109/m.96662 type:complete len:1474 (-) Transcript_34109:585-5006(-)